MLLQFSVENFLSFHRRATLSAIAAPDLQHLPGQTLPGPHGLRVLRTIAIYGANASGKSNLLKALAFAQRMVLQDLGHGAPIPIQPFRLDPEARKAPSHFELDFVAGGQHWSYGFLLSTQRVEAEWLFLRGPDDEEQLVFERTLPEGSSSTHIEIGPVLQGRERERFDVFSENLRQNRLILGDLRGRGLDTFDLICSWVEDAVLVGNENNIDSLKRWLLDSTHRRFSLDTVRSIDAGVRGLAVEFDATKALQELSQLVEGVSVSLLSDISVFGQLKTMSSASLKFSRAVNWDKGRDADVSFVLSEESLGTQQLLHLTPTFYGLTHADDPLQVACVDELERSLHPHLSRFLLQLLRETPEEEAGQLIFTTHDTNLLDLKLLSADGICFTEKDAGGASTLYTLAEFKPEQLEALRDRVEEGYLAGRFGAVPFLGDPKRLGWTDARAKASNEDAAPAEEG